MPNHVTNNLEFHCSAKRCQEILEYLRVDGGVLGSVDFNKLIPMPESLDIESGSRGSQGCKLYKDFLTEAENASSDAERDQIYQKYVSMCANDPQMLELGKQYYENMRDYGATTWYDWRWEHWGTKWNAYDFYEVDPGNDFISFNTAWSPVPELIKVLSKKFPEVKIRYSWADEDIGFNTGVMEFKKGRVILQDIPEGGTSHAYEIACDVQGYDISEFMDDIREICDSDPDKKPTTKSQDAR